MEISKTRLDCKKAIEEFAKIVNKNNIQTKELLYVGLGGDKINKGEYSPLFQNVKIKTLDKCSQYNPDIVADITNATRVESNSYDIIIMVQTMEHIPNFWDLPKELARILKNNGYLIIDCPLNYKYHAEKLFGDYYRITKDGFKYLFESLFIIDKIIDTEYNTSCLMRKK